MRRSVGNSRDGNAASNRTTESVRRAVSGLSSDVQSANSVSANLQSTIGARNPDERGVSDGYWADPQPSTVWEAIERIAKALYAANGGTKI